MLLNSKRYVAACLICLGLALAAFPGWAFAGEPKVRTLRKLDLGLPYVQKAWVGQVAIKGFEHKSLCVEFKEPTGVISTLEGCKDGVRRVGNHYVPRGAWRDLAMNSVPELLDVFWGSLGFKAINGAMLITGANMDNLAIARASFGKLQVVALVTAGVRGNAMRQGFDQGKYVEPGTINAIIMTNRKLSSRAMARALIGATEAKSAAMQDLDVRSSYQPLRYQATGTGTDNLIIVQGQGAMAQLSGGHSKLGELIARAMYDGVIKAVGMQNGLFAGRGVLARLKERGITPVQLGADSPADKARLERLVKEPFFSSWLEQALALEDAWNRKQLKSLDAWRLVCQRAARRCGARGRQNVQSGQGPLDMAFGVLRGCGSTKAAKE